MSEDRQRTLGDRTPSRGVRPAALLALALVVILVLAACGGSSSSEVDASAGGSDVAGVVQADDLAQPAQEPDAPAAAEGDQAAPDVGEDTDATTADTIEEISPEDAFPVFAQCLRDEGLDVTDPDFTSGRGPGGFLRDLDRDDPAVEAATETCRPLVESARPELSADEQAERQDSILAFTACLREQGLDVADPDFSGGGPGGGGRGLFGGSLDLNDPAVEAAVELCRDEVPGFGGRFGGGGRG